MTIWDIVIEALHSHLGSHLAIFNPLSGLVRIIPIKYTIK